MARAHLDPDADEAPLNCHRDTETQRRRADFVCAPSLCFCVSVAIKRYLLNSESGFEDSEFEDFRQRLSYLLPEIVRLLPDVLRPRCLITPIGRILRLRRPMLLA